MNKRVNKIVLKVNMRRGVFNASPFLFHITFGIINSLHKGSDSARALRNPEECVNVGMNIVYI